MGRPFRQSIRSRLILSYVLLTLLTVTLMGGVTLFLVHRYAQAQQTEFLRANAQAIAHQAMPLIWPIPRPMALHELVYTTAFLGNLQVRILDAEQQILVDSQSIPTDDYLVWVSSLSDTTNQPTTITISTDKQFIVSEGGMTTITQTDILSVPVFTEAMPLDTTDYVFVNLEKSVWGNRLSFSPVVVGEAIPLTNTDFVVQMSTGITGPAVPASQLIFQPIGDPARPVGFVELSTQADVSGETLATAQWAIMLAGFIATLTAAGVGFVVSQEMTQSLARLAQVATRMGQGELSARAVVQGEDEIGQLGQQFNTMAAQLETSFQALATERDTLRRFMADASHELYTPITALKTFNHLLCYGTPDPATQADFLLESQQQINRLDWIIRNLLDLSRLDAGLVKLELTGLDMREWLTSVAIPYQRVALAQGLTLRVDLPPDPIHFEADDTRLELALTNLLDNALKFTPPGGQISLGAKRESSRLALWVTDTGLGIAAADLPHVFERFYRSPAHSQIEGSGLGLAIVQAIVQAHGGQVSVTSEVGRGSCFTLSLPPSVIF